MRITCLMNNPGYMAGSGISSISSCKLIRYDGTHPSFGSDDFRAKRGLLIIDHYEREDVVKVQLITGNLCDYLTQEGIEHTRTDFKRVG